MMATMCLPGRQCAAVTLVIHRTVLSWLSHGAQRTGCVRWFSSSSSCNRRKSSASPCRPGRLRCCMNTLCSCCNPAGSWPPIAGRRAASGGYRRHPCRRRHARQQRLAGQGCSWRRSHPTPPCSSSPMALAPWVIEPQCGNAGQQPPRAGRPPKLLTIEGNPDLALHAPWCCLAAASCASVHGAGDAAVAPCVNTWPPKVAARLPGSCVISSIGISSRRCKRVEFTAACCTRSAGSSAANGSSSSSTCRRLAHDGARQRHPLPLPARQLARAAGAPASAQAERFQPVALPLPAQPRVAPGVEPAALQAEAACSGARSGAGTGRNPGTGSRQRRPCADSTSMPAAAVVQRAPANASSITPLSGLRSTRPPPCSIWLLPAPDGAVDHHALVGRFELRDVRAGNVRLASAQRFADIDIGSVMPPPCRRLLAAQAVGRQPACQQHAG